MEEPREDWLLLTLLLLFASSAVGQQFAVCATDDAKVTVSGFFLNKVILKNNVL